METNSRPAMRKIGMAYTGDREHDGHTLSFYSAVKATWGLTALSE